MFWYNAGEENKTIEKKIEKQQTETETLIAEMDDMADADEYEFVGDYINDFITDDEKEEEKEEEKEQGIVVQKVIRKRIRARSKARNTKIS